MSEHAFRQVDVFSAEPLLGNPVAVVHDADDLSEEQMAAFARWTNLSETTFLLAPTEPGADYRLRIFTPSAELPFAGHPTLGSAHAWLEAGGTGHAAGGEVVQECGVGLVRLRRAHGRLAFAAPDLLRSGPVAEEDLARIAAGLRIPREEIVAAQWVDNGPGWVGVMLHDAAAVLAVVPDPVALGDLAVGVVGVYPEGDPLVDGAIEVRAFVGGLGVDEDPVTGSLNAGIAQWLAGDVLPASYVASQGTALGRRGRVHVETADDGTIWVGGETRTTVLGTVAL
ncbi:PhzF family phenazine biosynthesis protein [Nocardioides sp. DS6]|uniref:PhzF family phenazine biosynthesis protein n=1 Tax=Nocardioides eburneus TaxID=3231482 RepID=A0ABV3SVY8_9ACTN